MLQAIKDNAKGWLAWVVVILISIPFALWGIHEYLGPPPVSAVAEVNGTELSRNEFYHNYRRQMQSLRDNLQGQDLSGFEKTVKQGVLNQMVDDEVLTQTALASGMRISDALVAAEIQAISAFQDNGKFSQAVYKAALERAGMDPPGFEYQVRRSMLLDQLRRGVVQSELNTARERETLARIDKQRRLLSYIEIPLARFADISIEPAEIEQYYTEHQKEFFSEEKASVSYVEFSTENLRSVVRTEAEDAELERLYNEQKSRFTTPPEWTAAHILIKFGEDKEAARQKAEELLQRAQNGEDFAELAKQHSADPGSGKNGGDLGSFGPGMMVKPFEDALRSMQKGDIKGLVETGFGFHIIKLDDVSAEKIKDFAEVRAELKQEYLREQAEKAFYDGAEEFANLAYENPDNLDVLAESLGLRKQSTELFTRGGSEEGFAANPEVAAATFTESVLKQGMNSEVLELGEKHLAVLRLQDYQAPQLRAFEEVKADIEAKLFTQKQREAAEQLGQSILDALRETPARKAVAEAHQLTWTDPIWADRRDNRVGKPALLGDIFRMARPPENQAAYIGVRLNSGAYAVAALLGVQDGASEAETAPQDTTRIGENYYNLLVESLKDEAEIKIHRDNL